VDADIDMILQATATHIPLKDKSVDCVITDPPYELGFMGKKWDSSGVAFRVETWQEVLRVMKPGAMLFCFGGTRTHHRLMCAIEDAGFEIRDCMMWLYGSGFPKSHDISKAIDRALFTTRTANPDFQKVRAWLRAKVKAKGLKYKEIDRALGNENSHKASHYLDNSQPQLPTPNDWGIIKKMLELSEDDIDRPPKLLVETFEREIVGYRQVQRGVAFTSDGPDKLPITKPLSPEAQAWEGQGTALKPAWEPIILAMKPLDGTFAQNALKWGVAGLNIDAGRIETSESLTGGSVTSDRKQPISGDTRKGKALGMFEPGAKRKEPWTQPLGRWPANVILSHHPECEQVGIKKVRGTKPHPVYSKVEKYEGYGTITKKQGEIVNKYEDENGLETVEAWNCHPDCPVRMLDEQSGTLTSGKMTAGTQRSTGGGYHGNFPATANLQDTYADSGGASRFFYCAKASRSERGKGNYHPTVKPLALIEYLVRLGSRPGHTIFDPFLGSGATIDACDKLNRTGIGQDLSWEYLSGIAQARIARPLQRELCCL